VLPFANLNVISINCYVDFLHPGSFLFFHFCDMDSILDFQSDLNIATFDKVVSTFFRSAGPEV
jgi:hypothetical protein